MNIIFADVDGVLNSQLYYETPEYQRLYADVNERLHACKELLGLVDLSLADMTCDHKKCPSCVRASRDWELDDIDPKAVGFLNNLITKTGAKIVISSTWRGSHTRPELQRILEARGFIGEIIDYTPHLNQDCVRGNEILKWMKDNEKLLGKSYHEFETYVIFDDDSDMLYWQRNNFILINGYVGLTPKDCWKAERLLKD